MDPLGIQQTISLINQQTVPEVAKAINVIAGEVLGELGRQIASLEGFISGLSIEITIPKIVITIKNKEVP